MGFKTFLTAAFSAGTLAANTLSEGIEAISGVTGIIGDAVDDWKAQTAYEREKEQALEKARTDLYYHKQLNQLKKEMAKAGIKDLSETREFFTRMKQEKEREENALRLEDIKL